MNKIQKQHRQLLKLITELDTRELLCYHVEAITGAEEAIDAIPDSLLREFSKVHKQLNHFCSDWETMNTFIDKTIKELLTKDK